MSGRAVTVQRSADGVTATGVGGEILARTERLPDGRWFVTGYWADGPRVGRPCEHATFEATERALAEDTAERVAASVPGWAVVSRAP